MKTRLNGHGIQVFPGVLETLESYLDDLLTGRCLIVLPGRAWALELPYDRSRLEIYPDTDPTDLLWGELSFETVLVHLPPGYPDALTRDVLAEADRVAERRILVLGRIVPVDAEGYFQSHRRFRLQAPHLLQMTDALVEGLILSVFEEES